MRFSIPLFLVALLAGSDQSLAQAKVDTKGITARVKIEEVLSGHLPELNGKFKLRATEVSFAPDGDLGVLHHVGPGIRYVLCGKLTFIQGGKTTIYQAGDYFYESGNIAHTAHNKTKLPLRVLFVEVLPAEWTGPTAIPPKAY